MNTVDIEKAINLLKQYAVHTDEELKYIKDRVDNAIDNIKDTKDDLEVFQDEVIEDIEEREMGNTNAFFDISTDIILLKKEIEKIKTAITDFKTDLN